MSTRIRRRRNESTWHWRARQEFGRGSYRLGMTYSERDGLRFVEVWDDDTNRRAGHFTLGEAYYFGRPSEPISGAQWDAFMVGLDRSYPAPDTRFGSCE